MQQYFFPYVRRGNKYIRLGMFMEELKATHTIRSTVWKEMNCKKLTVLTRGDEIQFWGGGGRKLGYIKKENVTECRLMKRTN